MAAPDFLITASMQDQLREYYSRKILAERPDLVDHPDIQFGNVYDLYIRMVNQGELVEASANLVDVTKFGAVGDGVTDDTDFIKAAVLAAGSGVSIYFPKPSNYYKISSPISISQPNVRVTGEKGTKVKTASTRTFVFTGAYCTLENITVERDITQVNPADATNLRANVAVGAIGFTSRNVDYINANMNCLYLVHAACDGARIIGGTMTNSNIRRNASGIYVAPGVVGNNNIIVDGVAVTGTGSPDGILIYDASDCTVRNCIVEHLRKIPTAILTGWSLVSGTVYRALDRTDNATMIVRADGVQLTDEVDTINPSLNAWGLNGGYVYVNVGIDPSSKVIESDMPSGYAIVYYWTETGYPGMNRNRADNNRITDVDGIGIYMQMQNTPTACRNNSTSNNVLKDVCLTGIQHTSLAFAGIGWGGGYDCVSVGDQIYGAGSVGKLAPGVRMQNQSSGRLVGVAAYGCSGDGFSIASANWTLDACIANNNTVSGYRVFSGVNGHSWRGIQIVGCQGSGNTLRGVDAEVVTSGSAAQILVIGGEFSDNGQQGVALMNCNDSRVIGASFRNNGAGSFYAIHIRGTSARAIVDNVTITGTVSNLKGISIDATTVDPVVGIFTFLGAAGVPVPLSLGRYVLTSGGAGFGANYIYTGSPEGVVTASIGGQYRRLDGGAGTSLYIKESGSGNTGWIAK